jgi:lipopolysaccharide transport system permease protein
MNYLKDTEQELVIRPEKGWVGLDLAELWSYRELIFFFIWKELKVRYKQTAIGILWVLFKPLAAMVVFSVFFGRLAKMPSDGIPYPIFVYVGLTFWNYFSFGLTQSSESMVSNAPMIQKVYFPRLVIPVSSSLTPLVDFSVSLILLFGLMAYYRYIPNLAGLAVVPLLVLISFFSAMGLGSYLAAINVKYRDVRHVVPFFIQLFMFLTPVIYPASIAKGRFKYLFAINPMSGVIETARSAILHTKPVDWNFLSLSLISATVMFIIGIMYFKKTERFFVDFI